MLEKLITIGGYLMNDILLMLPGPTTVHPRVLNAMSQAVVNHRGAKYSKILTEITELMSKVFQVLRRKSSCRERV